MRILPKKTKCNKKPYIIIYILLLIFNFIIFATDFRRVMYLKRESTGVYGNLCYTSGGLAILAMG